MEKTHYTELVDFIRKNLEEVSRYNNWEIELSLIDQESPNSGEEPLYPLQ